MSVGLDRGYAENQEGGSVVIVYETIPVVDEFYQEILKSHGGVKSVTSVEPFEGPIDRSPEHFYEFSVKPRIRAWETLE